MASTVVMVVLLDTLAELPANLTQLIHDKLSKQISNATVLLEQCDPTIVHFVLNKVKYGKTGDLVWKTYVNKHNVVNVTDNFEKFTNNNSNDNHLESYNTPDLEDLYSIESVENFIDLTNNRFGVNGDDNDKEKSSVKIGLNKTEDDKKSTPFLVAIFETLSNITAQTCAGTLLSSHWVVTAASCVNVLGDLTNDTMRSSYTVVAGSTNPLVDGYEHNVTEVLLSDGALDNHRVNVKGDCNSSALQFQTPGRNATLALMRIDPGVGVGEMEICKEPAEKSLEVTVYGWSLLKNDSLDAMQAILNPAKITDPLQCHRGTGVESTPALCLTTEQDSGSSIKMGSGGAVLATDGRRTRMLAVLLDTHAPMLAEPLARHAGWIETVLNENNNT